VGEDPEDWVERMAAHTRHYHFEDIAATRVHQHLIPGTGAIDFAATLRAISNTDYQGWITVELYPYIHQPDEAARQASHYLLQVANSLGVTLL
jgi:sugar phosphate isomerase/epimerase